MSPNLATIFFLRARKHVHYFSQGQGELFTTTLNICRDFFCNASWVNVIIPCLRCIFKLIEFFFSALDKCHTRQNKCLKQYYCMEVRGVPRCYQNCPTPRYKSTYLSDGTKICEGFFCFCFSARYYSENYNKIITTKRLNIFSKVL